MLRCFYDKKLCDAGVFAAHIIVNNEKIIEYPKNAENLIYRLAAPHEITHFYRLLHKHHKDWDAEKKKLVDWRWKPGMGDSYWVVTQYLDVESLCWEDDASDNELRTIGNCFRTDKEAMAMAEKIKKLLKE